MKDQMDAKGAHKNRERCFSNFCVPLYYPKGLLTEMQLSHRSYSIIEIWTHYSRPFLFHPYNCDVMIMATHPNRQKIRHPRESQLH